jgi:hypothetical protein
MSIYDKPVRLLFKDMVKDLGISQGEVITREQVFLWFKKRYPKIKDGTIAAHLLKMPANSPSRVNYGVSPKGDDDLFYQINSRTFRLYDPTSDPAPIYTKEIKGNGAEEDDVVEHPPGAREFAYEKDLQNFLSKNLPLIEPGLHLYEEEGITGIEFPVGNRYIDILALDRDNNYVVIELKVSKGYDRVVGQLLRYMAWIKKNQADASQRVRGVIVARQISDDLLLACSELDNVELYEYQLSVSLQKISM